jgi:phosphomannomutase
MFSTTSICCGKSATIDAISAEYVVLENDSYSTPIKNSRILVLFDVDGTLTEPREPANPEIHNFLAQLRKRVTVGIVGGSDLSKQREQMGEDILEKTDYNFSENGLVAYKNGELIAKQSIQQHLGEDNIKSIINFALKYIANLDIPTKRGTFIEFRTGMLNISPIGRNCSKEERNAFEKYDIDLGVRRAMIDAMKQEFADLNLTYSIGGQISFDVFPNGWDKTYCLNYIDRTDYDEIHFFGDKTSVGGNDYEIYSHTDVFGHRTTSPTDTMNQCIDLFMK